jgi:general L-amino acid transport system permease protein
MRLVILPQTLRIVVPPMTSTYLNVAKNSSLAIAIGFPDVVFAANTTMNQTGQAVELIALLMAVYLTLSLSISLFMNWYNKHVAIKER